MSDLSHTLEALKEKGWLRVIDEPLDVYLEIPHVAYVEIKRSDSRVLLFTRPVDKARGIAFEMPVVMNMFASFEITQWLFGRHPDELAAQIRELLHLKPPEGILNKLSFAGKLLGLASVPPKRLKGEGACQARQFLGRDASLDRLPILTTWEQDGGPFITMGQVYTQSLDGTLQNLGMYRLQKYDAQTLGMHWQIHKDSSHFFDQYQKAGRKMPVSIAIGGDPLYIWCGQAPMPYGMFELLLYGFVRRQNARLVKSLTNDIYIPEDVDIVIEGEVDPSSLRIEGPFGDHTGYYTLKEPYPALHVTAITTKAKPIYQATVVGKPPLEDKFMGWGTERIFLPLLQTTAPDLIDYHMPENGVFHNLILAKIKPHFKGHAKQLMHAFWGVGQMSFVKHAIFVDESAPALTDYAAITEHILNRLTPKSLLITEGIVDALDHSAPEALEGGKLGIDATGEAQTPTCKVLEDDVLLEKVQALYSDIIALKQYMTHTASPITVIQFAKTAPARHLYDALFPLREHLRIVVFVDEQRNDVANPYMLIWRVVNNIDALRDVWRGDFIGIDATNKSAVDGFVREWPDDVTCTPEVLESLRERGVIECDAAFIERFGLL
ncbi:MAG: menaquinone biosynthesis decarboxylase [Campylobacterales bacterium]|nr:menaquinone biosynthesis decarboxylase [Campylobacterales bacterium]